ncbi:MAG: sensor domain-containing diguanylate cyclase [Spirochaetes bacterium]|nr:sensor domain-containing diguanylate cyclase [Spirochaetota bacterium]
MEETNKDMYELKMPVEIEQYERKIYDLKQLIEISKGLNSTLDYNTLIDSILLTCMGQMQLLNAGIFLKKGIGFENYSLHRNYKGFEIDHALDYELNPESQFVEFLEKNYKCYTMQELEKVIDDTASMDIMKMLDPMLILPLKSKGELNGIIILGERIIHKEFSETEKEYLLNIASLAGIAIHNAMLYEMATTDMMTKLKIHHYFHTSLLEEMERAVKFKRPLSLIMIDIDHFKVFNDHFGHTAGDIVLINVARIIKENIRQMDIAARYGGEEFAVILPKTDINEALIAGERIRETIEKCTVNHDDRDLNVTVSVGLTQFDTEVDRERNAFLDRADKALYLSKANGRNMVSFL